MEAQAGLCHQVTLTFTVIAEAHVRLPESDSKFSGAGPEKRLKV